HYCVTNMPGAVGRTSTFALCNATLPWVARLAKTGFQTAATTDGPLKQAANIHQGKIVNQAVADAFAN
ncbi:MAG TPA: alanine dehydrogenase, partial [Planctomycetaceae bacterium]|nr:alanine dehydrogenase [Planctomycetaceae bacterium]